MTFSKSRLRQFLLLTFCGFALLTTIQRVQAQSFSTTNFNLAPSGTRNISFEANTNSYYILYSGAVLTSVTQPIAMALGTIGSLQLQDTAPQVGIQFYRVAQVPLAQPLDTDGDGMDDVFELTYSGCLNPLDPSDASADCDGDGRSNLQEFYYGTNPILADAAPRLVINEVDYDQIGTDTQEFVEVLNKGTNTILLTHYALAFINGANNLEYLRVNLNGALAGGQYLVVASTNLTTIAAGARVIRFDAGENDVQNGSPDGIGLINVSAKTIMDAFSYEGAMTAANIVGFPGTYSLVEGTPLSTSVADSNSVVGSLARLPDGTDANNAATDWNFTSNSTPGAPNVP
jgi:hypothetical protein